MNILLITPYYPPIISSLSSMMKELAEKFTQSGHNVIVATVWLPNKLSNRTKQMACNAFSIEKHISVVRIKSPFLNSTNYILRGISQLLLPYLSWNKIKKYVYKKIDAVLVYTPPLTFSMLGNNIKRKFGAKYLLNIQDIFPQNAIDLGIMKNKILIKFFEHIEKKAYQSADKITSHTKTSRKFLIEKKKIPSDKVSLIPNWIDIEPYINIKSTNSYRKKYGLEGKFIFLFAGVIGPSQGLELIIKAANEVKNISHDVCFLIVGDGTEKDRLMKMAEEYSLNNVVFRPLVSIQEYPSLVKDADVGIVCLRSMNKTPVIPGKIMGYMAASIPVVAFLNRESDGHDLIKEAKCGYSIISGDYKEAAKLIRKIFNQKNQLAEFGRNGCNYARTHFSKKACIDKLKKLIEKTQDMPHHKALHKGI